MTDQNESPDAPSKINGYAIASTLFCLSGLIWTIAGDIPIGMMNIAVGMMFLTFCIRRKKKPIVEPQTAESEKEIETDVET